MLQVSTEFQVLSSSHKFNLWLSYRGFLRLILNVVPEIIIHGYQLWTLKDFKGDMDDILTSQSIDVTLTHTANHMLSELEQQ